MSGQTYPSKATLTEKNLADQTGKVRIEFYMSPYA
jgi:hypothetical protein